MENYSYQPADEANLEKAIQESRAKLFKILGFLYRNGILVDRKPPNFIETSDYKPNTFYPDFEWEFSYPRPNAFSGHNANQSLVHVHYNDWDYETNQPEYPQLKVFGDMSDELKPKIENIIFSQPKTTG